MEKEDELHKNKISNSNHTLVFCFTENTKKWYYKPTPVNFLNLTIELWGFPKEHLLSEAHSYQHGSTKQDTTLQQHIILLLFCSGNERRRQPVRTLHGRGRVRALARTRHRAQPVGQQHLKAPGPEQQVRQGAPGACGYRSLF